MRYILWFVAVLLLTVPTLAEEPSDVDTTASEVTAGDEALEPDAEAAERETEASDVDFTMNEALDLCSDEEVLADRGCKSGTMSVDPGPTMQGAWVCTDDSECASPGMPPCVEADDLQCWLETIWPFVCISCEGTGPDPGKCQGLTPPCL